jgi:hypothetical protein
MFFFEIMMKYVCEREFRKNRLKVEKKNKYLPYNMIDFHLNDLFTFSSFHHRHAAIATMHITL